METLDVDGEEIPKIGLGTWQLKDRECVEAVKTALENGYRHVDTAQAYDNEEKVGEGLQKANIDRDEIWLTTKLWRDNLEKGKLKKSVDESLEKLGTDYVDLLLIHWPFPELDLEEVLPIMEELVEEGKVKNIGVSNFTSEQVEKAQEITDKKIVTNQVEYHPFLSQQEVLEECENQGIFLTAYSPLARGDVIGNETLEEIGEKYGKSAAQVSLRWLVQQDVVAIPKASTEEHIKQNLDVFDFSLTEEEMQRISELAKGDRKIDPGFAPDWD